VAIFFDARIKLITDKNIDITENTRLYNEKNASIFPPKVIAV
jgi:hypothetical protein